MTGSATAASSTSSPLPRVSTYRNEGLGPAQRQRLETEKAEQQLSSGMVERRISPPPASETGGRDAEATRGRKVDIFV